VDKLPFSKYCEVYDVAVIQKNLLD